MLGEDGELLASTSKGMTIDTEAYALDLGTESIVDNITIDGESYLALQLNSAATGWSYVAIYPMEQFFLAS